MTTEPITLLNEAVRALERWDGEDPQAGLGAVETCEALTRYAAERVDELGQMPASEELTLWIRLTSLGAVRLACLLGASVQAGEEGDRARAGAIAPVGQRLQDATARISQLTAQRIGARKGEVLS